MTTEQTAQQLELAAQIIRTGHPFQIKVGGTFRTPSSNNATHYIGTEIRLALATPPDGRAVHNPDNLTAEQVGAGWRLTVSGETATNKEYWHKTERRWFSSSFNDKNVTYRLPLSVPWPELQPDPYAELKKAHAEGKVIEFWSEFDQEWTSNNAPMVWCYPPERYRIKPEEPFQLPPPPPGMQWHRTDMWEESDLPSGQRPLVAGELLTKEDECCHIAHGAQWGTCDSYHGKPASKENKHPYRNEDFSLYHARTRRPLTFTHEGKQWTWHRAGDPMPCDGDKMIYTLDALGKMGPEQAKSYDWSASRHKFLEGNLLGWRYADEKKPIDKTIQELSDNEVIQLRKLLSLFTNLSKTPNENG